ncbi:1-alkyl-2-acetylglycerophosphocholine esterase [Fusarium agapanthi]|uniref:1-alkyl-2-acetylglycerophosphocholine esterase n=1 Tax=Fusarium agapanthi TaxID=1803897 RepID=A0A9P5BIM2_9HYPO|nr:1-alkyl-2-acetylglycerophosphocholine esterase [Fusarium agapanthi]
MQSIRKERRLKWLMVRQLWLWKLNDGTVLTATPSRRNMCMADDLLETIRKSNLRNVSSGDELMKHLVKEKITFPDKFMRAGLGEHILTIFEGEIASEADQEATFYNNFTQNDWDSKHANRAINCTWRVKDIRDELGLIRKVLTPRQAKTSSDPDYISTLQSQLEGMIKWIKYMDKDATTTLESAMLAQASLNEAESARLMKFIILPFTIVTVIFTPLLFMTGLFAVNSDGFPHNEDGELRTPSDWFWRKMVIGEFGTLIPLVIFVLFLYYSRRGPKNQPQEQLGP